ncbi:MAG: BrnA antitoxin family protein [Treponemataceae bacterium]
MKTAEQRYKNRPDIFAADGYEVADAPEDVAVAMDASRQVPALPVDFLPPPGELVRRKPKRATTIRINEDTLAWFKSLGSGYQTKINAILDSYKATHESRKT